MDNLEMMIGLVVAVLAIVGTILGVLVPMMHRMESRLDGRIVRLEIKFDTLSSEINGIHREIANIYRRLPAEPELALARR